MAARTPPRGSAGKPAARKPAAKPAARKQAARKPAVKAAARPAAKSPARKPAERKPAATRPVARKSAATRPAAKPKRQSRSVRRAVKRATRGDRPYLMGLVILGFVLLSMAWAPIKNLAAGSERIDQLTASRDALAAEVALLEDRKDQLMDPDQLELIAREEYGLVKPGEIPYVVVTPEADPQLGPVDSGEPPADIPWYRRVWSSVSKLWD